MFTLLVALWIAPFDDPKDKAETSKLILSDAVVCESIAGFADYVKRDEASLTRDEKLLVYYQVENFGVERVGKEYQVHLVQDIRVRRQGQRAVLQSKDKFYEFKGKSKQRLPWVFMQNTISLKPYSPGDYELEIIVHDEIGKGPAVSQILKFRVKKPDEPKSKEKAEGKEKAKEDGR